jgi:hypothetical protein
MREIEIQTFHSGLQRLANNKDMVAREGLEPPPPAFQGCALRGEIGGSIHAASELLPQESNNFPRFVADVAIPRRQWTEPLT